ncbi:putative toxin-antitoxin system toxin component, PIN family [Polynucleobacter brandtiae]|uniref:Putative PIN family toxin of toxin-antitoxin system n=1 Tax=Polynucleobacter brandtiae TaxID=1938816 RepID=A0A2M8VIT6_9BURK|nr:putative toxin-antitoxin system toxin component, PIN family [Polynucleobacter brandtiae]PJI76770.1 putative PIN family toxin of toxin-antitoxin system [Polynucleobacter brandtiae]
MQSLVLDTNVLLDIFVFEDTRAANLKQALLSFSIRAIASQKTLEEFADVISRPLFKLTGSQQQSFMNQWQSIAEQQDDTFLAIAPWHCEDPDDQIFLNLAHQFRPSILISKDKALLKLASHALKDGIIITSDYNAFIS